MRIERARRGGQRRSPGRPPVTPEGTRYVVVQAGGRGSRLEHLTANKPKCLLSVDGEPLLYRLFRQAPDAHFVVVSDRHAHVLETYLQVVPPPVPVTLVHANGSGSAAGLSDAIAVIANPNAPFLVIWCDLFLDEGLPDFAFCDVPVVGLSDRFMCRWSVDDEGRLVEVASDTRGVAGLFSFPNPAALPDLPTTGEFVQFLRDRGPRMEPIVVPGIREFGTVTSFSTYVDSDCPSRFFNQVRVGEREVVKISRVPEFDNLIKAEADWYEVVEELGFQYAPRLRCRQPLTIDRIDGVHPFDLESDPALRRDVFGRIIDCLSSLHTLHAVPPDVEALRTMYLHKTLDRLERVRPLIPNLAEPTLIINGIRCRNPLHHCHESWLTDVVDQLNVGEFSLIHGDPTFSNMLISPDRRVWLIDPRGTFGDLAFYGDPRYDWAKLLYSAEGNYDQFNRRQFQLRVEGPAVRLDIASGGWEPYAVALRKGLTGEGGTGQGYALDVIHALIWLSLSGYVLDDVDSILGAFYNGVAYLERAER